jgi:hypothetical protein
MPELDVSFLLADFQLSDTFTITRRADTIGTNGRTTPGSASPISAYGVVTQEEPAEIMRDPEAQRVPRRIFVASQTQMLGASVGQQPDLITWNGTDYVVVKVLPYSRFGAGFYEVVAESMTATDVAQ